MKIKVAIEKTHAIFSSLCANNELVAVRSAIDAGLDMTALWTYEGYPLALAVRYNFVELGKLLVKSGMPTHLNTASWYRNAETEEEFRGNFVFGIIEEDASNLDVCSELLDVVGGVNTSVSRSNPLTCISNVSDKFNSEKSDKYFDKLLALGADVDWPDEIGGTQLHLIVHGANRVYVPRLSALSKDIDNPGGYGAGDVSPLYSAAKKGRLVAVEALVAVGANVNFYSESTEQSVLDRLTAYRDKNSLENASGEIDKLIALLRERGAKTYQELQYK